MSKHTAGIMSVLRKKEEDKKQNRKTTRGEKKNYGQIKILKM